MPGRNICGLIRVGFLRVDNSPRKRIDESKNTVRNVKQGRRRRRTKRLWRKSIQTAPKLSFQDHLAVVKPALVSSSADFTRWEQDNAKFIETAESKLHRRCE